MRLPPWVGFMIFILPGVTATSTIFTDSTGDAGLYSNNESVATFDTTALDITAFEIEETWDDIKLTWSWNGPATSTDSQLDRHYIISFDANEAQCRIVLSWNAGTPGPSQGSLTVNGAYATELRSIEFHEAGFTITLPREIIQPYGGPYLDTSVTLSGIRLIAASDGLADPTNSFDSLSILDFLPDTGFEIHALSLGDAQTGEAELRPNTRVHTSNGNQDFFLFELEAKNTGTTSKEFRFEAAGVPATWDITLIPSHATIQGGAQVKLQAIVATTFAHEHGHTEAFEIMMKSNDENDLGKATLAVHFSDLPQPAGHHNVLYFHSTASGSPDPTTGQTSSKLYLNTLATDPLDSGQAVGAESPIDVEAPGAAAVFPTGTRFYVPLAPQLGIGLDWVEGGSGTIELPIQSVADLTDVWIEGEILLWPPGGTRITAATLTPTAPIAISGGQTETLRTTIQVEPGIDVNQFIPGQDFRFDLTIHSGPRAETNYAPQTQLRVMPGGSMMLPLQEYRDLNRIIALQNPDLSLSLVDAVTRAPPGGTGVIDFEVGSGVTGLSVVSPDGHFRVIGREKPAMHVAVDVPADAQNGEVLEALVFGYNEAGQFAVQHVAVMVDDSASATSPSEVENLEEKRSPAPTFLLIACAVFMARQAKPRNA